MLQMEYSLLPVVMWNKNTQKESKFYFDNLHCKLYDPNKKLYNTDFLKQYIDPAYLKDPILTTIQPNPKQLRIHLGYACNQNCVYCLQKESKEKVVIPSEKELDKFIEKIINQLELEDLESIQFWGGEPLLYQDAIFYITKQLRQLRLIRESTILHFLTNGTLVDSHVVDFCLAHDLYFGISNDGLVTDNYRKHNVFDCRSERRWILYYYNQLVCNNKNHFSISTTITNKNVHMLADVEEYFVRYFGEDIRTRINAQPIDITEHNQLCTLDDHTTPFWIFKYLEHKQLEPNMLSKYVLTFLANLLSDTYRVNLYDARCFIHRPDILSIDLSGNVYPCQNVCTDKYKLGEIKNVIGTDMYKYYTMETDPLCFAYCPVVSLCNGGCPIHKNRRIINKGTHKTAGCKSDVRFYLGILQYGLYIATNGEYVPTQI